MSRKRIIVLGAGLAGLSAAWHLQKKGIECQIFEKESQAGGLCRSKNRGGFTFDYDGHLLHFRHRYTLSLIKDLIGDNLLEHKRNAFIYFRQRYIRYPFQANLYDLPPQVARECLLGFISAIKNRQLNTKKDPMFLEWLNNTFGKGIARHFMIPYNTKFWTLPPEKLTCQWLDGFIPVPSLSQVIEGALQKSQRLFGYNARFWYPKAGGIGRLPLALADSIGKIHTNCPVIEVNLDKKEIKIASGNKEKFDYLISTVPLPEMPFLLKGLPEELSLLFRKLRWNSIFNLNLGIEKKDFSDKHWVYFPQEEICFFRVGFPHNFSPHLTPPGKASLYIEVAYSQGKPIDKNNIVAQIERDLRKVDILAEDDKILVQDINDIKYGYPIYDKNYGIIREKILKFLLRNNIISCGRYGSWRYMTMEDALLDGRKAAALFS